MPSHGNGCTLWPRIAGWLTWTPIMTPPFILDTDTLSLYQLKHPRVTTAVRANLADTSVTIITIEEQFEGWRALLRQPARPDPLARQYLRWTEAVASLAPFT